MKITPLDRQSLFDIALQTSGGIEAVFALSIKNNISVSDSLSVSEITTVGVIDTNVTNRYNLRNISPASDINVKDRINAPFEGIGFMGVEIDFVLYN